MASGFPRCPRQCWSTRFRELPFSIVTQPHHPKQGHLAREPVCKPSPFFVWIRPFSLENAIAGCKSLCPSGGVQNIMLGDPLYWLFLQVFISLGFGPFGGQFAVRFAPPWGKKHVLHPLFGVLWVSVGRKDREIYNESGARLGFISRLGGEMWIGPSFGMRRLGGHCRPFSSYINLRFLNKEIILRKTYAFSPPPAMCEGCCPPPSTHSFLGAGQPGSEGGCPWQERVLGGQALRVVRYL